jgi:hypothetical protein
MNELLVFLVLLSFYKILELVNRGALNGSTVSYSLWAYRKSLKELEALFLVSAICVISLWISDFDIAVLFWRIVWFVVVITLMTTLFVLYASHINVLVLSKPKFGNRSDKAMTITFVICSIVFTGHTASLIAAKLIWIFMSYNTQS